MWLVVNDKRFPVSREQVAVIENSVWRSGFCGKVDYDRRSFAHYFGGVLRFIIECVDDDDFDWLHGFGGGVDGGR